jgi:DNA-binding MarR family transcriptional regulator
LIISDIDYQQRLINWMDSPMWSVVTLAEELLRVFPNLGRLIALHMRESNEEETTLMQVSVLYQLQERPITASEIAKKRHVSLQSVSVLIQGMVERGWITRTPDPTDRRQSLLQITPEGMARAEIARNQIISYLADFLRDISPEEVAAAQIFLPALGRILTEHMAAHKAQNVPQEEQTPL